MVQIAPFKGVLYNQEKVGGLESVTAPPYDTISPEQQDALYRKSPYNIVRLILTKDEDGKDKYREASNLLRQWLEEGVLKASEQPTLYLYEQRYCIPKGSKGGGQLRIRRGIIARARIEDFSSGKILPHENTHAGPKADRLKLMQACKSNLSQIFSFYSEPEGIIGYTLEEFVKNNAPLIDIKDETGIEHCVWAVTDPTTIKTICHNIEKSPIFIADGHHRYETSLKYRELRRAGNPNHTGDEDYNYTMMALVNMDDADLTILPIHRLIRHLNDFDFEHVKTLLSQYFTIKEINVEHEDETKAIDDLLYAMCHHDGRHRFGMYGGGKNLYLLTLREKSIMSQIETSEDSPYWRQLDVTVLHTILIDHILKDGEQAWGEEHITYTIDALQAKQLVDKGEYQLAVFLNPTRMEQVKEIAQAGLKMPQKSTFFYPKVLTGLVINRFED